LVGGLHTVLLHTIPAYFIPVARVVQHAPLNGSLHSLISDKAIPPSIQNNYLNLLTLPIFDSPVTWRQTHLRILRQSFASSSPLSPTFVVTRISL
jgi:hypothetical protein